MGFSVLPTPYQFVALGYTIWVMPCPMKTAPGRTKYFQTITGSLVLVPTISQLTAHAALRGRESLETQGIACLPEMAVLDGDHSAMVDGKYILCILCAFLVSSEQSNEVMRCEWSH